MVNQQVGIRLVVAASHAPTQLVQLRQAEFIRTVHDDGVRIRHVNPRLDNRGAQQDIRATVVKIAHDALQIALVHLSVGNRDARFGDEFGEHLAAVLDGGDFVVQEIHLSTTFQFT